MLLSSRYFCRAEEEGFVVMAKIEGQTWSKETAEEFYGEHKGKAFFETLVAFMTSGPIVQLCLEKVTSRGSIYCQLPQPC